SRSKNPDCIISYYQLNFRLAVLLYQSGLFLEMPIINIIFIQVFIQILKTPFTILAPVIFILCLIGVYAPTQDMHDVWLMLVFGIVGYFMRKLDYPLSPAVLAIVLGPLAEPALRQSLMISNGDFSIFFTRTYAGPIMVVAIGMMFLPVFKMIYDKIRTKFKPA
ncbi:MAG: putative tricarboxylic transport membrane protein, partial [Gammaproteobacteria bacterium]